LKTHFNKKEIKKKENLLKARDASRAVDVVVMVAAVVLSENNDLATNKKRVKNKHLLKAAQ
jgi:hypothetical protein